MKLQAEKATLEADPARLYRMVDEFILPRVDFEYFARSVLGKHWKSATAAQREEFIRQFHSLLIRTYATALLSYTGQEIIYKPLQMKPGAKKARVNMEFVPHDGPRVKFSYSMRQGEDAQWRVFDIVIEGASLITNYRKSYGGYISQNGMEGLLEHLAEKNSELSPQ